MLLFPPRFQYPPSPSHKQPNKSLLLGSLSYTIIALSLLPLLIPSRPEDDWKLHGQGLFGDIFESLRVWFSSYSSLIGSIMSSSGVIAPKKCSAKSPCNWLEVLMLPYGNLQYQSCACYSNVNGNTLHHCSGVKPCTLVISLNRSICIKGHSFWNILGSKLIPRYCCAHDFCWE